MGYTHYWRQSRDLTPAEWSRARDAFNHIAEQAADHGIALADGDGEPDTAPHIDSRAIWFNGASPDDCETFAIEREPRHRDGKPATVAAPVFNFCKTRQRPYDAVAVAMLCYLASAHPDAFDVSSDGDAGDWEAGLTLARLALPGADAWPFIQLPAAVAQVEG